MAAAENDTSTFRLYLPSNASADVHPDNTPSCYTTQLKRPIQLEGAWEVGAESICYNTNIGDQQETGIVHADYSVFTTIPINNDLPARYKVLANNTWDYSFHRLPNVASLVAAATAKNGNIGPQLAEAMSTLGRRLTHVVPMELPQPAIFQYTCKGNTLTLTSPSSTLTLRFSNLLAQLLGYDWEVNITVGPSKSYDVDFKASIVKKLLSGMTPESEFWVRIFDSAVLHASKRIVIKPRTVHTYSLKVLKQRWKSLVPSKYSLSLTSSDRNKIIITNTDDAQVIVLNEAFRDVIKQSPVLVGGSGYWGTRPYATNPKFKDHSSFEWTIDIYRNVLQTRTERRLHQYTLSIQPRQFTSVKLYLVDMEMKLRSWLQTLNAGAALVFRLTLDKVSKHVTLFVPKFLSITFSLNLLSLLGFRQHNGASFIGRAKYTGDTAPGSLDQLERDLFIYADIVQETNYGDGKAIFLHHFLHSHSKSHGIVQQSFKPIVYLPLLHNFIGSITVKLLTTWHECVKITDSKTLLVLQFRRRKGQ